MSMFLNQLKNLAIVLVRPKYPENVGFVARVALNMGISQLFIVCKERPDTHRVKTTATHNAGEIVESIQYHSSLLEALSEFHLVIGTTARKGRDRQATLVPGELAGILSPVLSKNRAALVFGPEDRGLSNEELKLCGVVTSIPSADFSSFNVSHAVAIFCHEIFQGITKLEPSGVDLPFSPRLATVREQESAYADADALFAKMDARSGNEKRKKRLMKIRALLGRRTLLAKETRVFSEICRELDLLLEHSKPTEPHL